MPSSSPIAAYRNKGRWRAAEARAVLAAAKASGLSIGAFAAREGLVAERMYSWRRRFAATSSAASARPMFVEIAPRSSERVEIVLRCGRVLRVVESIDAALLRLVEVLEEPAAC